MISVIVPTVAGREQHLAECLAAYAAHTTDYELHVIADRPTCGAAWVEGATKASGDYIHFSADDLQPLDGWWQAGVQVVDLGLQPAPRILNGDGTLQTCGGSDGFTEIPTGHRTDFSRIPFMSREQWDKLSPLVEGFLRDAHYWTDNAVSVAAAHVGYGTAVHRGYSFIHHFADAGRGAGMSEPERMILDRDVFVRWSTSLRAGGMHNA